MYLKAVEIKGFKSFANKVEIEFKKGITSIVGPNGSGKSNVLDAIIWVLGEQSYKNLRAGGSQDVIFAGSKNKKGMASVSLIIDNNDGSLPIEYSNLKVTRKVYSSGENEYLINNHKVRLKDIQNIFVDTGIGKSAYSVIGQGKVEEIVLSNSKELKGIIDEAAGVKKHKNEKKVAEKKLEDVENNLDKIIYLENELAQNLIPLKEQAKKAEKYKELKEKREKEKLGLLKRYNEDKRKELKINIDEKEEIEKKINITENNFVKKENNLSKIMNEIKNKEEEIEIREKEEIEIREKLDENRKNQAIYKERKSNLEREEIEKINITKELEIKIKTKINMNKELEENKEELQKKLEVKKTKLQNVEKTTQEKTLDLKNKEKRMLILNDEILEFEINKMKMKNKIENNISKLGKIEKMKKTLQKEKEAFLDNKETHQKSIQENIQSKDGNKKELLKIQNKIKEIINEGEIVQNEIQKIKEKQEKTEKIFLNKKIRLENLYKSKQNHDGYFIGVKTILNAEMKGVIGPFISIIKIPKKYREAIQSIAGNAMQNIVIESSEIAKQCIEYLKKKQAGRASFLPLDTIKSNSRVNGYKEKGVFGYASELVEFDNKYTKIIDFVLGSILVVDNIDTALKIIKKNFSGNIVTLEGEVVSGKGKITGGGKVKNTTSMIFEREEKIEIFEKELKLLKQENEENEENYLYQRNKLSKLFKNKEENDVLEKNLVEEIREKKMKIEIFEKELKIINQNNETIFLEEKENIEDKNNFDEELIKNKKGIKNISEKIIDNKKESLELKETYQKIKKHLEEELNDYNEKKTMVIKLEEKFNTIVEKLKEKNTETLEQKMTLENENNKIKNIKDEVLELKSELKKIKTEIEIRNTKENKIKDEMLEYKKIKKQLEEKEKNELSTIRKLENEIIIDKNRDTEIVRIVDKLKKELSSIIFEIKEYDGKYSEVKVTLSINTAKKVIMKLENEIENIGEVNILAVEEYQKMEEKYNFFVNQKDDLLKSKKSLNSLIINIESEIIEKFLLAYKEINKNFNYMCQEVLDNSTGSLKMKNENDILNTGLELEVKFGTKKTQLLTLLSGGEKSMVAVALIMAIFMYKPSPFTFFDEIEAALDEINTRKLIKMLREFTDKSQFILITHNKETMKESDLIYGVTMKKSDGISKLISVEF